MATNDFLPFATGAGANVLPPATFNPTPARQTGFQAGVALSAQCNTVWRQSQFVAAMITQFIVDTLAQSVADDGNLAGLEAQFIAAILASSGAPPQSALWHFGYDTGAANAMTIPVLSPPITAYVDGMVVSTIANNSNTIPNPVISIMGLGTTTIVHSDLTALNPGDIQAGNLTIFQFDAPHGYWRMLGQVPIPQQALVHFGADTGAANAMIVGAVQPSIAALVTGMQFEIKKSAAGNTGSLTLQILNTTYPVLWPDGTGMTGGEWAANAIGVVVFDSTSGGRFVIVGNPKPPSVAYNFVHNGNDAGSVNMIVSNMTPAITQYNAGHVYIINQVAATNTGPVSANFNGIGNRAVTDNQGHPLTANTIVAGQSLTMVDNGNSLQLVMTAPAVPFMQTFQTSGIYTPSPGRRTAIGYATGGGGGGGGGYGGSAAGAYNAMGGGAGATAISQFSLIGLGPQLVTIGAGGSGGPYANDGSDGGFTTVGSLLSAGGGMGGWGGYSKYGAGGFAYVGQVLIPGNPGQSNTGGGQAGNGGGSHWGSGGTAALTGILGPQVGHFGGGGGGGDQFAPTQPGAAGGDGFVLILEY